MITDDYTLSYHYLIDLRSYGFLTYPSANLFKFIEGLEGVVLSFIRGGVRENTMFDIMDHLLVSNIVSQKLGCEMHAALVTQQIIYFYLTTRMYFASRVQKRMNESIEKSRLLAKQSKLVTK